MSWDKSYILELKADKSIGPMIENNLDQNYRIKILHRGEQLFYHDLLTDRALIVEIQVRNGSIFRKSIVKWDTGRSVENYEKEVILNRLLSYFINYQLMQATVR